MAALMLGALMALPVALRAQSKADVALRAAMETETVKGDIKAAIEQYKVIAAGTDRAAAAKALVRLGGCYQKLGNVESSNVWERVVRDFSDQAEAVVDARSRLAALARPSGRGESALVARRTWASSANGLGITAVSLDGRYYAMRDAPDMGLALFELNSGQKRRLTDAKTITGVLTDATFSPDGRRIAFGWWKDFASFEVYLIGIDGAGLKMLYHDENTEVSRVAAWSRDGKQILLLLRKNNGPRQMALMSVADGALRVLDPPAQFARLAVPGAMILSPDGRFVACDYPPSEAVKEHDVFLLPTDGGAAIPLVQHPADDRLLGWTADAAHVLFASDRARSWDAWIQPVSGIKPQGQPRLVKKEIGLAGPVGVADNGTFHYSLVAESPDVHVVSLDPVTGAVAAPASPISQRFQGGRFAPEWSADGTRLAYILERVPQQVASRTIVIQSVATGVEQETHATLRIGNDFLRWSPDGRFLIVRGSDAAHPFGCYTLDARTGDVVDAMPNGYWAEWSADGKAVAYARNRGPAGLRLRDVATGQETELSPGPLGNHLAVSPDRQWLAFPQYDNPPKVAMLTIVPFKGGDRRDAFRLVLPEGFGGLGWSADGRYLFFVRANNATNRSELWRIAVSGGEPQALGLHVPSQFSVHPDGRRLAFQAGDYRTEVWVLENFLPKPASAPTAWRK
jgi:Tol biopolymer transport system component